MVIICGLSGGSIDKEACVKYKDTWGPYHTLENCTIRTNQMRGKLKDKDFREIFEHKLAIDDIIMLDSCQDSI